MTEEVSMDDREREEEELADFDIGFQARLDDEPLDETASEAWKRGWHDGGMDTRLSFNVRPNLMHNYGSDAGGKQ